MSAQVITISSRTPDPVKEPYYTLPEFKASCKRRNINPHWLTGHYGGLISKPKLLLAYLEREGAQFSEVIVTDSWDVIIAATPADIVGAFRTFNKPIVFNCERSCFPRPDLAERFPVAPTPYRFLNSGFIVGQTGAVVEMLRGMKLESIKEDYQDANGHWKHSNDQEDYQLYYLDHQDKIALDNNPLICQSLHESGPDEFFVENRRITSRLTGNKPLVFHGNGSGKDWLKKIIGWMGL